MAYNIHDLGDVVRVSAAFTDFDTADAIDPDVVKLSVRTPAGVVTTYTYGIGGNIIKEALGSYYSVVNANEAGFWFYRFWSTGFGQAAQEKTFKVRSAQAV